MAGGEVCFQVFSVAQGRAADLPIQTDVGTSSIKECCIQVKALADTTGNDSKRNDVHTLLNFYNTNYYTSVTIFIQKLVGGVWTDRVKWCCSRSTK